MSQETPTPAAPKKSRKTLFIIAGAVVLLGTGVGAYWKLSARPSVDAAPVAPKPEPPAIIAFDPFVVNLADAAGSRYLRVTLAIVVEGEEHAKELSEDDVTRMRIRSSILEMLAEQTADAAHDRRGQGRAQEGHRRTHQPRRRASESHRCPLLRIRRPVTSGSRRTPLPPLHDVVCKVDVMLGIGSKCRFASASRLRRDSIIRLTKLAGGDMQVLVNGVRRRLRRGRHRRREHGNQDHRGRGTAEQRGGRMNGSVFRACLPWPIVLGWSVRWPGGAARRASRR